MPLFKRFYPPMDTWRDVIRTLLVVAICVALPSAVPGQVSRTAGRAAPVTPPKWYPNPPTDSASLVARGQAKANDQQLAIDRAVLVARTDIALALQSRWKRLIQEIRAEGITASEPAWDPFVIKDCKTLKQQAVKRRKIWTAFVLVTLPTSSVSPLLMEKAQSDSRWYQLVRNTRAIARLSASSQ
jgi:hypothetical protein